MATRILLFLLVCLSSVAQITNVSIGSNPNDGAGDTLRTAFSKLNTNTAWLASQLGSATNTAANKADRLRGIQVLSADSGLYSADPTNGYVARVFTGTTSADWNWNAVEGGPDITGERIRPTNYVTGSWIKGAAWATSKSSGALRGATLDSNGDLVASTATKQQIDKTAMQVATVAAMRALDPSQLNNGQLIQTGGRNSNGDGGGLLFKYVSGDTTTTNMGTVFSFISGTGRLIWTGGDRVDIRAFGAIAGDSVDDTAAIQDAVDFAEQSLGVNKVFNPPGVWDISTINVNTCEFFGVRPQQERTTGTAGTIFKHSQYATNHAILINGSSLQKPFIHDIQLVGAGNFYMSGKIPIASVASRLEFTISTNSTPTLADANGFFKQIALFYTSENAYLGSAEVTAITNSGAFSTIYLGDVFDNFANPSSAGFQLDTSCTVLFSPIYDSGSQTYADAAAAGYSAISLTKPLGAKISNVTITKFHNGIYVAQTDSTPYLFMDGVIKINNCEFSGIASSNPFANSDFNSSGIIVVSGGYTIPYGSLGTFNETVSVTNSLARNCSFGYYSPWSVGRVVDARTDACVVGMIQQFEILNSVDYALFDNCIRHGFVSLNGRYDQFNGAGSSYGTLYIRPYFGSTNTTPTYFTNKTALIVNGTAIANDLAFDSISIPSANGAQNFNLGFDISGLTHKVLINNQLGVFSGVSTVYKSGSRYLVRNITMDQGTVDVYSTNATTISSGTAAGTSVSGNTLTIQSQAAASASTNQNGGQLVVQSGKATGTGTSSVAISTPTAGASGTSYTSYGTRADFSETASLFYGAVRGLGEFHSFGSGASIDTRFGINMRPTMSSSVNAIGLLSQPILSVVTSGASGGVAGGVTATAPLSIASGLIGLTPVLSGSGAITNWYGVAINSTKTAQNTVGLYINPGNPATVSGNYAMYLADTNVSYLAGPVYGVGNNHALGASSFVDSRFGLYVRPVISSTVNAYGIYSQPTVSGNPAGSAAAVAGTLTATQPTATAFGFYAPAPTESGSGVITNWVGLAANTTAVADNTVGLYIGTSATPTITQSYSIFSTSSNPSHLYGSLSIGSTGAAITSYLSGTATYDAPSLATMSTTTTTVTVTGAAVGDPCTVGLTTLTTQGLIITANVSAANTVTVVLFNPTVGSVDLSSGTLRAGVWKH